jgi:hypothetical protein
MSLKLNSIPTLVESPFIIATIGGVTFGSYSRLGGNGYGSAVKVTYPNFMESLTIVKVNGTVNTYTLNFSYQVRPGEDPNLLDKIFSRASSDRKIILQYGDWNAPSYIYKEETAIITSVTSSLDMNSAKINYTLMCTSDAIGLNGTTYTFPSRTAKPSDVLMEMVTTGKYGLNRVFTGMNNKSQIITNNLIPFNDKEVKLNAQIDVSPLDYIVYLVDCMINQNNILNGLSASKYFLTIHDDYTNTLGGTYFKINEVSTHSSISTSTDTYEIDINYPGDNFVTQFSVTNDQAWSILYDYNKSVSMEQYSYSYTQDKTLATNYSPSIMKSPFTGETSAAKSTWWTKMTQFPIQGSLTIKGLMRPSILMTHVKLNVLFNGGMKHTSSGLYVITRQEDTIDANGYKTTLNLLRIGGD